VREESLKPRVCRSGNRAQHDNALNGTVADDAPNGTVAHDARNRTVAQDNSVPATNWAEPPRGHTASGATEVSHCACDRSPREADENWDRRQRAALTEWLQSFRIRWCVFLTLTFAGNPPKREHAKKDAYRFMERVECRLGFRPPYVGCVEGDSEFAAKRTHVHMLIGGVTRCQIGSVASLWPAGRAQIETAREQHLAYILKDYADAGDLVWPPTFSHRVHLLRRREAHEAKRSQS
jgi:hypothetical protein